MRERKLHLKQLLFIDFMACFLIGIVFANVIGADSFRQNGGLTHYYLKQFEYADIQPQELLWNVGCNRMSLFLALFVLGMIVKGKQVHVLFVAWSGFAYGYFCVMSISTLGAKGLLLCMVALFPQFLAYVPVYLGLVQMSVHRNTYTGWRRVAWTLPLLLILIVGILLESYINPLILQKVLKIF